MMLFTSVLYTTKKAMTSEILIKGMVCERCVIVIRAGMNQLGYNVERISLGRIVLSDEPGQEVLGRIEHFLYQHGFNLIPTRETRVISRVKALIDEALAQTEGRRGNIKYSRMLAEDLHMNYDTISGLFSKLEGITLEKYIIAKRLEKVKELIVYSDLTLTEIASMMGFNSINHLSGQFKQLTGHSPSHFKAVRRAKINVSRQNGNL